MNSHSLALAASTGQLLALILYGAYLVTFFVSMFYLVKKRHSSPAAIANLITLVNVIIFLLVTGQLAIIFKTALYPFFGTIPDASTALLLACSPSNATTIAQWSLLDVQISVSNSLLVYRAWIMCKRKWSIIVLPICSLVGFIVCEAIFLSIASTPQNIARAPDSLLPFGSARKMQLIALACDVITNGYCTVFILYKIWGSYRLVKNATPHFRSFSPSNVMAIIVESASLYTASIITLFAAYAHPSISGYVVSYMLPSIAGIAYCLIIIRFGMGGALKNKNQLPTFSIPWQRSHTQHSTDISMQPMEIRADQGAVVVDLPPSASGSRDSSEATDNSNKDDGPVEV